MFVAVIKYILLVRMNIDLVSSISSLLSPITLLFCNVVLVVEAGSRVRVRVQRLVQEVELKLIDCVIKITNVLLHISVTF